MWSLLLCEVFCIFCLLQLIQAFEGKATLDYLDCRGCECVRGYLCCPSDEQGLKT